MEWVGQVFAIVSSVVSTFSVIATVTPNRHDNVLADTLCRIVNLFGMNFGKAKNSTD